MTFLVLQNIEEDILKNVGNHMVSVHVDFHYMNKKHNGSQREPKPYDYQHSLKYLILLSTNERKSCRFGMT